MGFYRFSDLICKLGIGSSRLFDQDYLRIWLSILSSWLDLENYLLQAFWIFNGLVCFMHFESLKNFHIFSYGSPQICCSYIIKNLSRLLRTINHMIWVIARSNMQNIFPSFQLDFYIIIHSYLKVFPSSHIKLLIHLHPMNYIFRFTCILFIFLSIGFRVLILL